MANKKNNLIGQRVGMMQIISESERRSTRGDIYWVAKCDCGCSKDVLSSNWKKGAHASCGCMQRKWIADAKKAKKPTHCTVDGCLGDVFLVGICKKHYERRRKFNDVNYVTPESVSRDRCRDAQLKNVVSVKATTYRKLFGRHEHRVVAEAVIGRPLKSDEHVHHKDGNKHNNAPDNLVVMTRSEHLRLHALEKINAKAA
jgi:hypothetical protein